MYVCVYVCMYVCTHTCIVIYIPSLPLESLSSVSNSHKSQPFVSMNSKGMEVMLVSVVLGKSLVYIQARRKQVYTQSYKSPT